jgi:hypothetical protein
MLLTSWRAASHDVATDQELTQYMSWIAKSGRQISTQDEMSKRAIAFAESLKTIEDHNALYSQGLSNYKQAPSWISDMLEHEKEAERANNPPRNEDYQRKAFDWTTFKANTADEEIQKAARGVTYLTNKNWAAAARVTP